jgi:coenzyme F420 hydrogenase subunit beta
MKSFALLRDAVISQGLCARCGICVGVCPNGALGLDGQNFPLLTGRCAACGLCAECCPGADADLPALAQEVHGKPYEWSSLRGHSDRTYVACAADQNVRQAGASGGIITALLLFLLSIGQISGAVIVEADPDKPYLSRGKLAVTAQEIKGAAKSKYCVVPSMAALQEVRRRPGKVAVVARPCQVHGLRKLAKADSEMFSKIEVILGLYCSCAMNPEGHLEAMQAAGIRREEVAQFEFRGGSWPGGMIVRKKDGTAVPLHHVKAYGTVINTMFRLFGTERCSLCIDGLNEFADLSFGDFWAFDYADDFSLLECRTLLSQRTDKGMKILLAAERSGAVVLKLLPEERFQRRTLEMVKGKRSRAVISMAKRRKQGLPNPNYHIAIPEPGLHDWKRDFSGMAVSLLRGEKSRHLVLRAMLSPLVRVLHGVRMNLLVRQSRN